MKKLIKDKWIAALKSGKYDQGVGRLKSMTENTFCCLGVLTDLYLTEHNLPWDKSMNDKLPGVQIPHCQAILPKYVMDWAGLHSQHGTFEKDPILGKKKYHHLTAMNDDKITFEEIAEIIEKHPLV